MVMTITRRRFAQLAAWLAVSGLGLQRALADSPPTSSAQPSAPAQPVRWSDASAPIPVTSDDPMWGERAAPITLVVYGNYQCPFTRKLSETLEDVKKKYGPKKLRVIWKHNPLDMHKRAKPAAIAAEVMRAKGGGRAFFAWTKLAFDNQKDLSDPNFAAWALQSGVPLKVFSDTLGKPSIASKVARDMAEAKAAGVRGTPHSFINGISATGAQTLEKLVALIDDELPKALALKVNPDRVYLHRCNANVQLTAATPQPPPPRPRQPILKKSGG